MANHGKLIMALFTCLSFNTCVRQANTNISKGNKMTFIENLSDSLYSGIEDFSQEQQFNYKVYINTRNSYDALVNNLLIGHDYGSAKQEVGYLANKAILKSGKQKLQIRLYPEYKKGRILETFTNDDYLKVKVERYIWNINGFIDKKAEIIKYELPKFDANGNLIDYTPKNELTIDLEFEAKVPYTLKGWTDGIVFNKNDSVKLKKKLVNEYNKQIEYLKHKQFEKVIRESIQRDYEQVRYYYLPKTEYIRKFHDSKEEKETYLPLENYEIYFYGDGRLITLRRIDNENMGDGALVFETIDKDNETWITSLELYFYQPQGSDKLVLIR